MADETIKVRTLARIDDPHRGGASIRAGITAELPKAMAERLIAEGKAEAADEKVKNDDR